MSAPVIAIDAMGGDFGPRCIVPAVLKSLAEFPALRLILVGDPFLLEPLLHEIPALFRARLQLHPASEAIGMADRPSLVLRRKPDSSMRQALERVRLGEAQACVSAGNTGALMALARHLLKTLPGIDRPAIVRAIPTRQGQCYLLDLGANVDCTAEHLYQFALMGSIMAEISGIPAPRVALLNVGTEFIKGNQQVKKAAALLEQTSVLNYTGFIEGDGLFRGAADVAVCDGFVGNIVLKSSEGLASLIAARLSEHFNATVWGRAVGLLAMPILRRLQGDLRPARYNGASFLGLQGIVVKSHGSAGVEAFCSAIRRAVLEVQANIPQRLHQHLMQTPLQQAVTCCTK